jgi:hypothetical protein
MEFVKHLQTPKSLGEVAELMGIVNRSAHDFIYRLRKKGVVIKVQHQKGTRGIYWIENVKVSDHCISEIPDTPQPPGPGFDTPILNAVGELSEQLEIHAPPKDKNPIFHFDNAPILIVWVEDLHLGHRHTQYDAIKHMMEKIAGIDGVYIIAAGDIISASTSVLAPNGAMDLVPTGEQMRIADEIFGPLKGRVLCVLDGNHEMRVWRGDQIRIGRQWAKDWDAIYGQYDSLIRLSFDGGKDLNIYTRHKAKGNSQYNPLHPCIRSVLFDNADVARNADVIVVAHQHETAAGFWKVGGKQRIMLRPACMVKYDDYAATFTTSGPGPLPGVIFWPDGKMLPARNFYDLIDYLKFARIDWNAKQREKKSN